MRIFSILIISFFAIFLSSCSQATHTFTSPNQTNQVCENLKEKLLLNSTQNVPDEQGYSPTEQARLLKEYQRNNCDQKLGVKDIL